MRYKDELRKLAEYHEDQAQSLDRDRHVDALLGPHEGASAARARSESIDAHRARARALCAEADQEA